eukprot:8672065-Alexandrium_andersonii.AAC.1
MKSQQALTERLDRLASAASGSRAAALAEPVLPERRGSLTPVQGEPVPVDDDGGRHALLVGLAVQKKNPPDDTDAFIHWVATQCTVGQLSGVLDNLGQENNGTKGEKVQLIYDLARAGRVCLK